MLTYHATKRVPKEEDSRYYTVTVNKRTFIDCENDMELATILRDIADDIERNRMALNDVRAIINHS